MKLQVCVALLVLGLVAGPTHARNLQQSFSSASAVSTSGGSGPDGNCGSTSTVGNAQAFASGPPCSSPSTPQGAGGAPVIPAPPPSTTCPTTTQVVNWGTAASYPPLNVCPGSAIEFKWNTQSPSQVFGLYQIPSATCPASATAEGVQLLITPASSPNTAGFNTVNISVPGTYYFTDIANCGKGVLQQIVVSTTAPPATSTPAPTTAAVSTATAQASSQATAGRKL